MNFSTAKFKLIFLLIFLLPSFSNAQPLFLENKEIRVATEFFYGNYKSVFDMDGERKLAPKTTHAGVNLNVAAAFHSRWNGMISLPIVYNKVAGYNDPGGISKEKEVLKQGDIEVGLKYSLPLKGDFKSCFTGWQSLGTAKRDGLYLLHTGYADYNSRVYFDLNYKKYKTWTFGTYLGFNKRYKNNSDEVHAGLTTSFLITKNLFFDARGDLNYSLENQSKKPINYELGLYHNNARLLSATGVFRFEKENGVSWFVSYKVPIRGQYIFNTEIISVGFTFKISKSNKVESTEDSTTSYFNPFKIN